jgi:hypothetical protein
LIRPAVGGLTPRYGPRRHYRAMPDTLTPLELPRLPTHVARPPRRERAPDPWRARVVGAVLLAHILGVVVVDRSLGLRERPPVASAPVETVFEVRFVPPEPVVVPAPAESAAPVTSPSSAAVRPQPPTAPPPQRDDGVAVEFLPATPEPSIDTRRLFDPNGAVRLPDGFVDREAPAPRDPMAPPASPVPFERTRFDGAWEPDGENLAQEVSRKVPLLGLILAAGQVPDCPPNSTDIRCEAMVQEQRARIPPTPQSAKQPW